METVEKKNKNGGKIALWIIFSIIIVALVIAITILIIEAVVYNQYRDAFYGAIFTPNACIENRCSYFNIHPSPPVEIPINSYSKELALFCSQQILNLEWYSRNKTLNLPPSLELIGTIVTSEKGAPIFGYVAIDSEKKIMYIIFRGTETPQEWQLDLSFQQNLFNVQTIFSTSGHINWTCPPDTAIHKGFLELFKQMQNQIENLINPRLEMIDIIIVSGHSLGGAITSITSVYLSSNITTKPIIVYTFGKPRVGNTQYMICVNNHFENRFWRVENESDFIVTLPLSATPNIKNFNNPFIYSHEGSRLIYSLNWNSLQTNHSMNNYIYAIQNNLI